MATSDGVRTASPQRLSSPCRGLSLPVGEGEQGTLAGCASCCLGHVEVSSISLTHIAPLTTPPRFNQCLVTQPDIQHAHNPSSKTPLHTYKENCTHNSTRASTRSRGTARSDAPALRCGRPPSSTSSSLASMARPGSSSGPSSSRPSTRSWNLLTGCHTDIQTLIEADWSMKYMHPSCGSACLGFQRVCDTGSNHVQARQVSHCRWTGPYLAAPHIMFMSATAAATTASTSLRPT